MSTEQTPLITGNITEQFSGLGGGIGNQLFVIANVLAISWDNNINAFFRMDSRLLTNDSKNRTWMLNDTLLKNLDIKRSKCIDDYKVINESDYKPTDRLKITQNTVVVGYFQNHNYFDRYRRKIIDTFKYTTPVVENIVKKLRYKYTGTQIIGIQIRRTDYITLGWDLSISYFQNAIKMFEKSTTSFVISTDDKEYCKTHFPNIEVLDYTDIEEFCILSQLDGCIISNSTFGWWIAYLGEFGKNTVVPFPWNSKLNITDGIYLDEWTKCSV